MRPSLRATARPTLRQQHGVETAAGHMAGIVLLVGGMGMLVCALVDLGAGGPDVAALAASGLAAGVPGLALWRLTRPPERMPHASIFAAVLTSWVSLSLAGTLPYLATGTIPAFHDAVFESVSGFTTTGATILAPIEGIGAGVLLWRAMTQWFGGMGVIVLAVAVLPFLGVGGLGLLQAESPGPTSERLAPRVRETARRLWILYAGFTLFVAAAYGLAGMSLYDAVAHSFTTVSTGGFSPYDASILHFSSPAVEWIAIVAMFLAGGSFVLYWRALRGKPLLIVRSPEALTYVALVWSFAAAAVVWNAAEQGLTHDVVRGSVFTVVSLGTTTGYTTVDYTAWASVVQLLLLFGMAVGGMTGSTAGGFKVFRLAAVLSYGRRQAVQQLHPRLVRIVRLGHYVIPEEVVNRIVGFFGLFMAVGAIATIVVAALGADMITAISAAAATLSNVGPGLGEIGPGTGHYLAVAAPARTVLAVVMLVGRLEIFPVILGVIPVMRFIADRLPRRVSQILLRLFRG